MNHSKLKISWIFFLMVMAYQACSSLSQKPFPLFQACFHLHEESNGHDVYITIREDIKMVKEEDSILQKEYSPQFDTFFDTFAYPRGVVTVEEKKDGRKVEDTVKAPGHVGPNFFKYPTGEMAFFTDKTLKWEEKNSLMKGVVFNRIQCSQ